MTGGAKIGRRKLGSRISRGFDGTREMSGTGNPSLSNAPGSSSARARPRSGRRMWNLHCAYVVPGRRRISRLPREGSAVRGKHTNGPIYISNVSTHTCRPAVSTGDMWEVHTSTINCVRDRRPPKFTVAKTAISFERFISQKYSAK